MNSPDAKRVITLTNRRPVLIREAEWPVLAEVSEELDGVRTGLKVRQHVDGRVIVYGTLKADQSEDKRGYLLLHPRDTSKGNKVTDVEVVTAIRQTADELDAEELGRALIAALPPEVL